MDMKEQEWYLEYYRRMMEMQMMMMDPCNQVKQEPNHNRDEVFQQEFEHAIDYDSPESVLEGLPHLQGVNQPIDINKLGNSVFFVIRSTNDDDIHKAIKYHHWASSLKNNQVLSKAYQEATQQGQKLYLIFSVVKSGQFCAVAQMTGDLQPHYSFRYWWEPNKYFGTFQLKWVFIKDIKDKLFAHLKEESQENKVVFKLRDSTRICVANGKAMMNIFNQQPSRPNIFGTFAYMDRREDLLRTQRLNDPTDSAQFNQMAAQYRENKGNPAAFRKRPMAFTGQGLYGNPFYQKKQNKEQELQVADKFFFKDTDKKDHRGGKKRKQPKRDNYYQAGQHYLQTVEVHYQHSEDEQQEQLPVNDNHLRPVQQQEQEQQNN